MYENKCVKRTKGSGRQKVNLKRSVHLCRGDLKYKKSVIKKQFFGFATIVATFDEK